MKVHLIKRESIEFFVDDHANSRRSFVKWLTAIKYADWDFPDDIIQTFRSADLLGGGYKRVVFNIGGNNYRVICKYHFGLKKVHLFVCWVGTHNEYNDLCRHNGQYHVFIY